MSDPSIEDSDAFTTSLLLTKAIKKIKSFDLIICGEAAIDGFAGQVPAALAERLSIPQLTYVRKISLAEGKEDKFENKLIVNQLKKKRASSSNQS